MSNHDERNTFIFILGAGVLILLSCLIFSLSKNHKPSSIPILNSSDASVTTIPVVPSIKCVPANLFEGLTKDELRAMCGKPSVIGYIKFRDGSIHEQWTYYPEGKDYGPHAYVYVDNNEFSSSQWSDK